MGDDDDDGFLFHHDGSPDGILVLDDGIPVRDGTPVHCELVLCVGREQHQMGYPTLHDIDAGLQCSPFVL